MTELSKIMRMLNNYDVNDNNTFLSCDYDEELFDLNYRCLIKKDADIIVPKYLVLHLNNDGTLHLINEIKKKVMFLSLTCKLDNINIYNISLKLLMDLSLPRIINNKLYILLPPYLFSKSVFNCINNTNTNLILSLVRKEELINIMSRCSIILYKQKISYSSFNDNCENGYNNIIIDNLYQRKNTIQQVRSLFIKPNTKTEIFTNNLQAKGIVKGLFIHADIHELIELKIFIDYQVYLHYDYYSINGYCNRINPNLIFVPLGNGCDYLSTENISFLNAVNFNNIVSSTISLRFRTPQEKIILHILMKNEIIELNDKSRLENYYDIDQLNISNIL
jgi:hypothetical protein